MKVTKSQIVHAEKDKARAIENELRLLRNIFLSFIERDTQLVALGLRYAYLVIG